METQLISGNEHTRIASLVVYFCFFFSAKALAENFYAILSKPANSTSGEKVIYKNLAIQTFSYFLIIGLLQSLAYVGLEPIIDQAGKKQRNNDLFYIILL